MGAAKSAKPARQTNPAQTRSEGGGVTARIIQLHQPKEQSLWSDYLALKQKAERSGRLEDAVAAGKAWARFLKLFEAVS